MPSKNRTSGKDEPVATRRSSQPADKHSKSLFQRQIRPATVFQRSGRGAGTLQPDDVLQLQRTIGNHAVQRMITQRMQVTDLTGQDREKRTIGNHAVQRMIIQRMQVTDLTEKDQEKWYVIQDNVVAKLTGVYNNHWEFRIRDDLMGNDRYVNLTSGKVVPMPHFGIVIQTSYAGDDENWFGEFANRSKEGANLAKKKKAGKIREIDYKGLLKLGEQMPKNEVGVNDYDKTHVKVNEGIWTDGMGPCITIALTGVYKGFRINVLHHSFVSHYDPKKYAQIGENIVNELTNKVQNAINAPLTDLKEQEFYVVGGDKDTAPKMEALLRTMIFNNFNIVSVVDKSGEAAGKSSKALLISANGTVSWSYEKK